MQSRRAFIFFLLGVCMVIWSLCIFYVMIMPKGLETEVYVRPAMTYSSSYKGASTVTVPMVRRSSWSLSSAPVSAPRMEMKSMSTPMSGSTMRIATTSSARVTEVNSGGNGGNGAGYGQASSGASSKTSRGINYTTYSSMYIPPVVQGFITSASSVSGGRSAEETYARMQLRGVARAKKDMLPPGVCDECHWEFIGGRWICTICGHDALDGCDCADEHGYCRCPIEDGWPVWLFMTILSMVYGLLRKQSRRKYSL